MSESLMFTIWVLLLAAFLFWPASNLVWTLSVRRLERKLGRKLSDRELQEQLRRARIISAVLVLIFSWLFNAARLGVPGSG